MREMVNYTENIFICNEYVIIREWSVVEGCYFIDCLIQLENCTRLVGNSFWNCEFIRKEKYMKNYMEYEMIDLAYCGPVAMPPMPECKDMCKRKKDENPMNYNAVSVTAPVADETAKQRRYMIDRVERDYYKKSDDFGKQFNLNTDAVQSPQEMAEYIKNGWFTIRGADKTNSKDLRYWSPYDALEFRKVPADKEGYEAAKVALKKARQDALDVIAVLPLDKGFEAMKAFADFTVASK